LSGMSCHALVVQRRWGPRMHTHVLTQHTVAQQVLRHRILSRHIAARFNARLPRWVDADDVRAAADMGLVDAATRFDAAYGVPFGGYARLRIAGSVRDHLRALDPLSRSARQQAKDARLQSEVNGTFVWPVLLWPDAFIDLAESCEDDAVDAALLARERVRFVTVAVLALPASLACVVPCGQEPPPLRTLAVKYGVSVSTVSRQRRVAFAWLHAAVAFYDGMPARVNPPSSPRLRSYLRQVTKQAAVAVLP